MIGFQRIFRLVISVLCVSVSVCSQTGNSTRWFDGFDEALKREIAGYPPDRPLVIATNLWLPNGYEEKFGRPLTLVNIGDDRLLPYYRIDAYLAVAVPEADDPTPREQVRENPGRMLLKLGSTPLRADEQFRWLDLADRNEMTLDQIGSAALSRLIAIDETKGVEIAFRPWISLSETRITVAGKSWLAHELIRLIRPGLEIIYKGDTLSLRYSRPAPLYRFARLFTRAYPVLLGPQRPTPVSGFAVWMDRRRGLFSCPEPAAEVRYCNYEELDGR